MRYSVFLMIPAFIFGLNLSLSISPELFVGRSVEKPAWMSLVYVEDPYFSTLLDPFAEIDLSFNLFDGKVLVSAPLRVPAYSNVTLTNLPSDAWINAAFVEKAFWYFENDRYKLTIGRKKRRFGYSRYPLSISDSVPFLDGLDFRSGIFSYHLYLLDSYLTPSEKEKQCETVPINSKYAYCDPIKIYMAHFLNFDLGNLKLSIGESALFWGKSPTLELNPFMIWHFLYEEGNMNSQLISFGRYSISGITLKYEIVVDDIALPPYETPDVKPTALGYSLGLEFSKGGFGISMEYYHTDDWLYNREVPYSKFTARFLKVTNTRYYEEYPLGFPFGPGSDALMMTTYFETGNLGFFLENGFIWKKNVHIWSDYKSTIDGTEFYPFSKLTLRFKNLAFQLKFLGVHSTVSLKITMKVN